MGLLGQPPWMARALLERRPVMLSFRDPISHYFERVRHICWDAGGPRGTLAERVSMLEEKAFPLEPSPSSAEQPRDEEDASDG
mmetsp:Transcript_40944/g.91826  ORF Transcript_40944/g.91826 Transcript_40944/m.91826 type:complete len:83 (+) Transcript_40944:31-279(+)